MSIKLVVFDMAGTTVEDKDNVHASLIQAFKKYDFSILREDANKVMGIPKPVAIQQLLKDEFGIKSPRLNDLTVKIHKAFLDDMISFYKNDSSVREKKNASKIFELLKEKKIKVGIDTGFSRDIADTIIKRLEWKKNNLIDFSVTSDEVKNGRPHPDMIFEAMKIAGIKWSNEVAKVGDTVSDLQEGTSAGCKFVIGITTGAYTRNELAKAKHTHLITDLMEVADIVTEA